MAHQAERALDTVELRRLVDLYCLLTDRRDYVGVAALFLPDGSLTTSFAPAAVGRVTIQESLQSSLARFAEIGGFYADGMLTQHAAISQVCDFEGDTATGVVCGQARLGGPGAGGFALLNVLRYEDEYRRVGGRWRFRSRRIVRLWTERASVLDHGSRASTLPTA